MKGLWNFTFSQELINVNVGYTAPILRDPHRSGKDPLFFLGIWSIQNPFQNADLVLPDGFCAECLPC